MPVDRGVEQALEKHRLPILRGAFVEPSLYQAQLEARGVMLSEGEPVGVLDARTVQAELQLLGVNPKIARPAARAIANELKGRQVPPRLFSGNYGLSIEPATVAGEPLYVRSDIDPELGHKRLGALLLVLAEEPARREQERLKRLAQQAAEEAERKAELAKPSTATIITISTFTLDTYTARVAELSEGKTGREIMEEIPHELEGDNRQLARVLQRSDTRRILDNGLDANQFEVLIDIVRAGVIGHSAADNERIEGVARAILDHAEERIQKPGNDIDMPIYLPRDVVYFVLHKIRDLNQNSNIKWKDEIEEAREGVKEPLPRYIANVWVSRFDEDLLMQAVDDIKLVDERVGNVVEAALLDDNAAQIFSNLRRTGKLALDGVEIDKAELEGVLAPVILNDLLIAQAVFTDVLGEIYAMPYFPKLTGEGREVALFSLRYVAERFSMGQIQELLAPHYPEVPQIDTIKEQLSKVDSQLKEVNSSDRKRGQALERDRAQLSKRLVGYERQRLVRIPNRELIQKAFAERLPMETPDPRKYTDAEQSIGYTEALRRYELAKEAQPGEDIPNSEEYILGVESEGYQLAVSLHQIYLTLIPQGWVSGKWSTGQTARTIEQGLARLPVPAMLPPGVFSEATRPDPATDPVPVIPEDVLAKLKQIPGLSF